MTKLTYRGISYEYTPVVAETTNGQIGGKYRGLDWRFRNLKKPPVLQPRVSLTYRGVTYNRPSTETVTATAPAKVPALSMENKARLLMNNHSQNIKKRQQSLLYRVATEIGLSDKAVAYWNRIQGKIHPTFRINYDRQGVALS